MVKAALLGAAVFALVAAPLAWSQEQPQPPKPDDKFRPEAPKPGEDEELTPEKAMAMLKEVRELMDKAEELLNSAARGKALEAEKELLDKIDKLLKDEEKSNPASAQQKILEKIERLMGKSEGSQKGAIEKMGEIIKKAKS